MSSPIRTFQGLLFMAAALVTWEAASRVGLLPLTQFSRPSLFGAKLLALLAGGGVWEPTSGTLRRMMLGWLSACVAGMALASAIRASATVRVIVQPTLHFLRPLPASALVPPAILILGLSDQMIVGVIAFGTLWPVLDGTLRGLDSIEPRHLEVARILRLTPGQQALRLWIPAALSDALTGVRIAMGGALILAVVGEMLASQPGLGSLILQAARTFRSDELYAGVVLIAVVGVALGQCVSWVESSVLQWRELGR